MIRSTHNREMNIPVKANFSLLLFLILMVFQDCYNFHHGSSERINICRLIIIDITQMACCNWFKPNGTKIGPILSGSLSWSQFHKCHFGRISRYHFCQPKRINASDLVLERNTNDHSSSKINQRSFGPTHIHSSLRLSFTFAAESISNKRLGTELLLETNSQKSKQRKSSRRAMRLN